MKLKVEFHSHVAIFQVLKGQLWQVGVVFRSTDLGLICSVISLFFYCLFSLYVHFCHFSFAPIS